MTYHESYKKWQRKEPTECTACGQTVKASEISFDDDGLVCDACSLIRHVHRWLGLDPRAEPQQGAA